MTQLCGKAELVTDETSKPNMQDFSQWRKAHPDLSNPIEADFDENHTMRLSLAQEASIVSTYDLSLATLRDTLPGILKVQTQLCTSLERVSHRSSMNATDLLQAQRALGSFGVINSNTKQTTESHRPKELAEDTTLLNRDLERLSEGLSSLSEISDEHAKLFEKTTLEKLKLQRETWRALSNSLDRYMGSFLSDDVQKLENRIKNYQKRYTSLQYAAASDWVEEGKKLQAGIEKDQDAITAALKRRIVVRWIMAQEVSWVWRYTALLRVGIGEWMMDESAHASRVARIWTGLEEAFVLSD